MGGGRGMSIRTHGVWEASKTTGSLVWGGGLFHRLGSPWWFHTRDLRKSDESNARVLVKALWLRVHPKGGTRRFTLDGNPDAT